MPVSYAEQGLRRSGNLSVSGSLKCLAHSQAPGPTAFTLGEVGANVEVVFAAQLKSGSSAYAWQEVIGSEDLFPAGEDSSDAAEGGKAEPLREREAIFKLGGNHVTIEVATGFVSSQFVVCAIDAVGVEGRAAADSADGQIVGKDLVFAQSRIFVE